jgi:transcriptional regulator with XRE-family HTH domain
MRSFGLWLRESREVRGLAIEDVADATRLPARVLAALENDDAAAVPDLAYAVKYARAAAEAIGLDPEDTALRYEEWRATLPAATVPPPPGAASRWAARVRALPRDPVVWGAIAATIIACGVILLAR